MPAGALGQQITFAAETDPDANYTKYLNVKAARGDTIKKIAAKRGHPELADEILKLNKGKKVLPVVRDRHHHISKHQPALRSTHQTLRTGATIRLPGTLKPGEVVSVTCADNRPRVTAGYAKYDIVDVAGRIGLNRFLGYDPLAITIPIQFESYHDQNSQVVETGIQKLERMAGRGDYPGSAFGPPAVIRVSVTDNHGNIVPLIPTNYQWTTKNQHAPLYRITGIDWADGALSDDHGRRLRQDATVTVTQYTPLTVFERSVARRTQAKAKPRAKR